MDAESHETLEVPFLTQIAQSSTGNWSGKGTCFHNSCWFPKRLSLLLTARVYLTCDTNYSWAGQQRSHSCPRMGQRSSSLSKDRSNVCIALLVPSRDTGPSDVSSGAPQAVFVLICASEEKD